MTALFYFFDSNGSFNLLNKYCNNIPNGISSNVMLNKINRWCQYVDKGTIAVKLKNCMPTKSAMMIIAKIIIELTINNVVLNNVNGLHTKNKLIRPDKNIA